MPLSSSTPSRRRARGARRDSRDSDWQIFADRRARLMFAAHLDSRRDVKRRWAATVLHAGEDPMDDGVSGGASGA